MPLNIRRLRPIRYALLPYGAGQSACIYASNCLARTNDTCDFAMLQPTETRLRPSGHHGACIVEWGNADAHVGFKPSAAMVASTAKTRYGIRSSEYSQMRLGSLLPMLQYAAYRTMSTACYSVCDGKRNIGLIGIANSGCIAAEQFYCFNDLSLLCCPAAVTISSTGDNVLTG
jgi:hypothetical protein